MTSHGIQQEQMAEMGRETLETHASDLRKQLIAFSFNALKYLLRAELAEAPKRAALPLGADIEQWVLKQDTLSAPEDGSAAKTQATASFMVAKQVETVDDYVRIRVHVPLGSARVETPDDISELLPPEAVYVEHIDLDDEGDARVKRMAITPERIFEYTREGDPNALGDTIAGDDFGPDLWESLSKRVDSGLPAISQVYEDIINADLAVQRITTVGETALVDLWR